MNLTSKRMLPFLTVCAGVCALSASAEIKYVADNFEHEGTGYTNAYDGMTASIYKMATEGGQELYTNLAWHATAGDASTIVTGATPFTVTSRPLAGDTTLQYLKLETEGQTLSRYVNFVATNTTGGGFVQTAPTTISFETAPIYVDTLIQFTPSEDAPDITDSNIKLALFVNASSNLVLRHKCYNDSFVKFTTNSVFESLGVINPQQWYRLTIKMSYVSAWSFTTCELWLDGQQLTHYNGFVNDENLHNGPLFIALTDNVELNEVSFQGTGAVDELVVTDTMPTFETTGLTLTLAFNEALLDVTVDSANVTNGQSIASGATLNIAATNWYQIASVSGAGITYDGTTGEQVKTSTGVITADVADRTATIAVTNYTGTIATGLPGAYANVPADKLSAWAINSGLTEADVIANAADYLDNYLLNIDESVDATISIKSIVVDSVARKATITVEASDAAVDFTGRNGELVVWTSDDLTSWGEPTTFTIKTTTETVVTIEVSYDYGNFIKARVE